jgi:large subunit ribosomal protein L25
MAETAKTDAPSNILQAASREGHGKGPARRLRAKGLIPAVVYRPQGEPAHVSVDPAAIQKAIATPKKFNTLLTLKLDGGDKQVLFKDYQVDPVTRKLLHADFFEVSLDKPVKVAVPVAIVGKAEGVTAGGILQVSAHEIVVESLPDRIPVAIEVDVTPLKIGQSVHIADVKAPEGTKIKYQTNYTVAVVAVPEKEEVVAPVAAAAVPGAPAAEGAAAAAPAAGGAAPAAGAAKGGAAPAAPAKGGEAKGGAKK